MTSHYDDITLGLGEVVVGRPVHIACSQRAVDAEVRLAGAGEIPQRALTVVTLTPARARLVGHA